MTLSGPNRGKGTLFINDKQVGAGNLPQLVPITFGLQGGLTCGYGSAPAVSDHFKAPFRFTGTVRKVAVDLE
jgi:arylsulfatase